MERCSNCGLKHNAKVKIINKKIGEICIGCLVQYLKQHHESKPIADFLNVELAIVNKYWFIVKRDENLDNFL